MKFTSVGAATRGIVFAIYCLLSEACVSQFSNSISFLVICNQSNQNLRSE